MCRRWPTPAIQRPPRAQRLLAGRGCFVDDIQLPRMLHAAFVRSPYPHARILSIDAGAARSMPGVMRIVTGEELSSTVASWRGEHGRFPRLHE